ncbi:Rho termination factor N-terminal domain-containing protein [Actinopolymorpha sp. NPDC004070]|uniref:Rho termination factor N-terminal domain-containing protein n=1 Tax=Actinopolymorpha sp. NPDC004070 TaxID=3154548 RepID=UPI0033B2495C
MAATGVRELPSNVSWVVSQAIHPSDGSADGDGAPTGRERAGARGKLSLTGDSLESRLKRAQSASEKAHRAEQEALAEASHAKELADAVRRTTEEGRARVRDAKSEGAEAVRRRVEQARERADALVEGERERAEADADAVVHKVGEHFEDELDKSRARADAAQRRAQEKIAEATARLAQARQLADEAAEAAQAAAEAARGNAEELAAGEVRRQTAPKERRAAEATAVQKKVAGSGAKVARRLSSGRTEQDLRTMTKAELTDLAGALGVETRSSMNKQQLLRAVRRAARKAA